MKTNVTEGDVLKPIDRGREGSPESSLQWRSLIGRLLGLISGGWGYIRGEIVVSKGPKWLSINETYDRVLSFPSQSRRTTNLYHRTNRPGYCSVQITFLSCSSKTLGEGKEEDYEEPDPLFLSDRKPSHWLTGSKGSKISYTPKVYFLTLSESFWSCSTNGILDSRKLLQVVTFWLT